MMNSYELLTQLLRERGVENVGDFLNPPLTSLHSPFLLKNMEQGIELLAKHMNNKSRIRILVDTDADGFTSASIMYQFIEKVSGIQCSYITHSDKQHGLYYELFDEHGYDFDLLICPDSSSNDVKMCKKLKDMGKDILIIDHHLLETENTYAVVINNQDGQYPNRTLVAGAVVYKFIQAFKQTYQLELDMRPYLALASLALIGDMADLRNLESRLMTLEGLKLFKHNEFLKEMCIKQSFAMKDKVTITTVAWSIAPLVNAVIRIASYEDKIAMFEAMCGMNKQIPYKPKKSKNNPNPVETMESIQKYMARKCGNIKKRQDDSVKKHVQIINDMIKEHGYDNSKMIIIEAGELPKSYTGLVANKLAQHYKRPCLILRRKDETSELFGGSGRNYSKFELDDLRGFLNESGLMTGVGHSNSFGANVPASNLDKIRAYADEKLSHIEIQDVYHVDYALGLGQITTKDIMDMGMYQDIWGGGCDEPIYALTDIFVTVDQIQLIGEKKNKLRITTKVGNQEFIFIKHFANEDYYNKIIHRTNVGFYSAKDKRFKLTIIGKFKLNEWGEGNQEGQIEIVDMTSELASNRQLF